MQSQETTGYRVVSIRLTPEEARLMDEALARDSATPSEHLRAALLEYWLRPRAGRRLKSVGE